MPYGSVSDVEARWRSLTAEEAVRADELLAEASRTIDAECYGVADRIAAGTLSADLAGDVAVNMVIRRMKNPDGLRSEQVDDYRYVRDDVVASGEMYLTDQERRKLSPRPRGAFSITLGR